MAGVTRVLYVDDEPDLLDIGKLFLEAEGDFVVTTLPSAGVALEQLSRERYDTIISDYQMPEMDGITFLKQLKASGDTTPFIIFTGRGREEVAIEALNEGADFYIQKGGEPKAQFVELANKVRYAVTRKRAEEALSESQKRTAEIIEFLPDATLAISTDGVVIAWNRAMEIMTGVEKGTILNKGDYEYSLPFYGERRPILIDLVLEPDEITAGNYPVIRKEGDRLFSEIFIPHFHSGRGAHLWFTASPLYDSQGIISGAIESIRDITSMKQAEVDLRESEIRYRHVVEDQTEFICRFLPDGTYVFVNEAYCRYFGQDRQAIIGTRFQPDIHPEDRGCVTRLIASLSVDHPLDTIDQRTIMPDGSTRWQRWVDRAIFAPDGSLKEYQSVGRDITATKQDEAALRESEERFRTLLERLQSVAVQGYLPDYTVVYWNEANTRMYGYTAEEAIGRDIRDLLVPVPAREEVTKAIARMAETGIPEPSAELDLLHKDGSLVPVFSSHAVVKIPGKSTVQFCFDVDLSERKKAENVIRESEELFRGLFGSANDAIFLHDLLPDGKPGRYTKVNDLACQRLGYTREELLGMSPTDIVSHGHLLAMPKIVWMLQHEGHGTFDAIHRRKDGTEFPVEISTRILELHGKKVALSIARDITERKRTEDALKESEEKYRRLTGNVLGMVYRISLPDGKYDYVSPAALHLTGYPPEDYYSDPGLFKKLLHPGWQEYFKREWEAMLKGDLLPFYEYQIIDRAQKTRWLHQRDEMVKGEHGYPVAIEGVITDITDRKMADENLVGALKRTRDQQAALGTISISPHLLSGDVQVLSARLTEVSSGVLGAERASVWLFDSKGVELQCIDLYEAGDDRHSSGHVLKRHEYEHEFDTLSTAKYIDAHDPLTDPRTAGYVEGYLRPNRITSMLDAVIRVAGQNLGVLCFEHVDRPHHWEGDEIAFACLLADQVATALLNRDRKQAEEALAKSELFNRGLVENLPDYIVVYGPDGKILYVNPASVRVMGYGEETLTGTPLLRYVAEEHRDLVVSKIAMRRDGDVVSPYVIDLLTHDGRRRSVIVKGTPIQYHDSPGTLLVLTDITERKQAEDALEKSEKRYHNVVEDQTEFICRFLPDGTHIFVNDAYCRYFGRLREEIIGHRFSPVLHPDDRQTVAQHLASITPEHPVMDIDQRIIMPDGSTRWQRWSDRAIFDQDGRIIEYQSVGRDITDMKEAEEALREGEEKYRLLAEQVHDGIYIYYGDRFIFTNTKISEISLYSHDELLTMSFIELVHPDDHVYIRDIMEQRMRGEPVPDVFECRIVRKDRVVRQVELAVTTIPYHGGYAALGAARDITERKQAEEALRESEEKYRLLAEQVHDGIYIYHSDRFIFTNTHVSEITGYSPEELLAMPFIELVHPDDKAYIRDIAEQRWRGEPVPVRYECRIVRKDGVVRQVELAVTTIPYQGGYAALGAARDITERKRADDALQLANKKLTLLSGITRHDINNQLTVLQGYLAILEKKHPDPALNEYFEKVSTAAERISAMIRFTKEYESIGVTAPAWQDARTLVETAAREAPLGKVRVKNDLPAGMEVFADPLISKVFYNLLDNAVRYGGKISTIRFSLEERDGNQILACEDDGNGVSLDEKEKIFDRGFGKNTGLGLFLSREILSITGITIHETGVPGRGARFEMTVPKGTGRNVCKGTS